MPKGEFAFKGNSKKSSMRYLFVCYNYLPCLSCGEVTRIFQNVTKSILLIVFGNTVQRRQFPLYITFLSGYQQGMGGRSVRFHILGVRGQSGCTLQSPSCFNTLHAHLSPGKRRRMWPSLSSFLEVVLWLIKIHLEAGGLQCSPFRGGTWLISSVTVKGL